LYCSRAIIINKTGEALGRSLLKSARPNFANALIQNIASGNTMVFNTAARTLLCSAGNDLKVFAHDWWTYLAVVAVGGIVVFDPHSHVKYRQHGDNQIGATLKLPALLRRSCLDLNGRLKKNFRQNISVLEKIRKYITQENLSLLEKAPALWHHNPLVRTAAFLRLPFKRQKFLGNCSLALSVILGRI
jgi:hypothetical protein